MKHLILLALTFSILVSCNNSQQIKDKKTKIVLDSISILPNWQQIPVIKLELKKTKSVKRNGVTQTGNSIANIDLKISKIKNNKWQCQWKVVNIHIPSINNQIDGKIEKLMNGFNYIFTLDSTGSFIELKNWQEIQSKSFETLEIIITEIKNQPSMNPQIIEQIRINVSEMFNTKVKIETFLMQEVQLYFALGGVEMVTNDTIEGLAYSSHPLTGQLVMQNVKTIYQNAYSDSTCDIQIIQTIDESHLYDIVKNSVDKVVGKEKTNEFEKEMHDTKFNLKIITDYNVSLKTGLVEKVIAEKNITIGSMQKIDKIEITKR